MIALHPILADAGLGFCPIRILPTPRREIPGLILITYF